MPDNKSWRKKIHNKQPKDLAPSKIGADDNQVNHDAGRRQLSWRKTVQSSRPETPLSGVPTTPTVEDAENTRRKRSEPSTPHRNSKPKLARYTSLFSSFKESSRGPESTDPWSEEAPSSFEPYVDPMQVLQCVRSHMVGTNTPIPLDYNNGLFRIFEDYRKVRDEKERLETLSEDILKDWRHAESSWWDAELCYKAEIRRLDLLIAKGTDGMAVLFKVRQESVVDRTRSHAKTDYKISLPHRYSLLSQAQLDDKIRAKSQRALLLRSASPSARMTILSRQIVDTETDSLVDTPESGYQRATLSHKVHSELDLTNLSRDGSTTTSTMLESAIEIDTFIALRELGELVARRRGLKIDSFMDSLTTLFTTASETRHDHIQSQDLDISARPEEGPRYVMEHEFEQASKLARTLRRFQSQPQLNSDQRRRRHFSFEPGDDQLKEFEEELESHDCSDWEVESTDSDDMHTSPWSDAVAHHSYLANSTPPSQSLNTDFQKPSKIPSPLQTLGHVRRETSESSSHSVFARPVDRRRDSNCSVLTAYRERPSNSARPASENRSSSIHKVRAMEKSTLREVCVTSLLVGTSAAGAIDKEASEREQPHK